MPQILQARLQQYVNCELPGVHTGFRKGRGTTLPTSFGSSKKQESSRKKKQTNINFCFIHYAKSIDCVDHKKLWKILKEVGIPDNLIFLLRNLYAGQESTFRTGHQTTAWFQIRKGVYQDVYSHPAHLTYMESTS